MKFWQSFIFERVDNNLIKIVDGYNPILPCSNLDEISLQEEEEDDELIKQNSRIYREFIRTKRVQK